MAVIQQGQEVRERGLRDLLLGERVGLGGSLDGLGGERVGGDGGVVGFDGPGAEVDGGDQRDELEEEGRDVLEGGPEGDFRDGLLGPACGADEVSCALFGGWRCRRGRDAW